MLWLERPVKPNTRRQTMKTGLGLCACVLVLVGSFAAPAGDKKEAFDATKLVGMWKYASGEKGGEAIPADNLKKQNVKIDKKEFTLTGDDATFIMDYVIDAKKS